MLWTRIHVLAGLLALTVAGRAGAVEIPPEGACPPARVLPGGDGAAAEDVMPPDLTPGTLIPMDAIGRLRNYLPREVWERRNHFFYEGMRLEIGPCYRRYRAPPFFQRAGRTNAGRSRLDESGNLLGYAGAGLPFPIQEIADDAPDAGQKWAWNYLYRYPGSGFRGDFRVLHVMHRGRKIERFQGVIFFLPSHGQPGGEDRGRTSFRAGGSFSKPTIARGVAWRQFRPAETDRNAHRSDEIFVYVPEERKVRRAPPTGVDGLFMPSYTRGLPTIGGKLALPDGRVSTPDPGIAVSEHWRRGFVGMAIRPNAYRFQLIGTRDVIAPLNSIVPGYPTERERSYGPSGLSVASDRWDVRRAVVIEGTRQRADLQAAYLKLYLDAQTQQPLYWITRRANRGIFEVGIFVGRFSGDDPLQTRWEDPGESFGVILPVAESMFVAGGESWLRESYALRSDPPTSEERADFSSVQGLTKQGR